jgi:hypothetical protein
VACWWWAVRSADGTLPAIGAAACGLAGGGAQNVSDASLPPVVLCALPLDADSFGARYAISYYWAVSTSFGAAAPEGVPCVTAREQAFATCVIVSGLLLYLAAVGIVNSIMGSLGERLATALLTATAGGWAEDFAHSTAGDLAFCRMRAALHPDPRPSPHPMSLSLCALPCRVNLPTVMRRHSCVMRARVCVLGGAWQRPSPPSTRSGAPLSSSSFTPVLSHRRPGHASFASSSSFSSAHSRRHGRYSSCLERCSCRSSCRRTGASITQSRSSATWCAVRRRIRVPAQTSEEREPVERASFPTLELTPWCWLSHAPSQNPRLVCLCLQAMQPVFAQPRDSIISKGGKARGLYIIQSGRIAGTHPMPS